MSNPMSEKKAKLTPKEVRARQLPYERRGFVMQGGPLRPPRKGEWYVGPEGLAIQATIDFASDRIILVPRAEGGQDASEADPGA
jgi:hypothetical protein